ncbi:peptidase S41 [Caldovatus sediminis]|uniref:Peptidase S41 n=1 Tax=Caldovatus sediminis TaxID=2041189 RepID=A0A8J2ZEN9_9PROT|nr:S41 family peptidase [Caldovatus sediminis]GGG47205.1 peptidase S41 [Caldovatus sediminis]
MPLGAPPRAQDFPRAPIEAVLTAAFEAVLERHLEPVTPPDLGLWSLRGLTALDPALLVELRGDAFRLLPAAAREGPPIAARRAPPPPTGAAWPEHPLPDPAAAATQLVAAIAPLIEAAWAASPAIRRAGAEGVLRALFEELFNYLDPYSRYITAAEAQAARERRVGHAGLGLRLAAGPGASVRIAAVVPGGPAARARLRAGDRLLAIDGQPVSAAGLADAVARLEGPENSLVTLLVARGNRRREVLLVRSPVPPETVSAERRDDILWLRLAGFSSASDEQLAAALGEAFGRQARHPPPRGVVLDLRGNRGGLLNQALAVADLFLAGGEMLRTVGRHPEARRVFVAGAPELAAGRPIVVLVDGRSASASEVVAAALSDRGRAVVVGSTTMGKGLIQLLLPLPDGGELLLSWSRLIAPRGWPIQGLGVMPAVCTSLGASATERAMERLIAAGEPPMAEALARHARARVPVPPEEIAALRNACPPAEGREADLAVARLLLHHPRAWQAAARSAR